MSVRTVAVVAVECDHRDGDVACRSVLHLRPADPATVDPVKVLVAAEARGWGIDGGQRCPKHRRNGRPPS